MGNTFNMYSFLALAACLLTGALFAFLLYAKKDTLSKPLSIILAVCRTISIALILWFLFSPLIRNLSYTLEKPVIVIAQDNSLSIGHVTAPGFDSLKYKKELQQLAKELSEKYDIRLYNFSDQVAEGLDFTYKGKVTNAELLTKKLNDELVNRNVGAIVLATDGIFNKGGNPAAMLEVLKAPVYTIAMGDTIPQKDVLIANINSSELVYLDNDFSIEVEVQAYQADGQQSMLVVMEDGKKIHEETIKINSNAFFKSIPVRLKAATLGQHRYTVSLSALSNEVSLENNKQQLLVEVIDDRQKILIAAAGPHPDIAALRQSIALNKHYDVTVVMREELLKTDPKAYGLVVLYQLPGNGFDAQEWIDRVQSAQVSLLYILGAQSNINRFNQLQNQVNISGNNGSMQYTYSDVNRKFSAFELDSISRKVIQHFDPLQAPFGQPQLSNTSQIVLNQRIGKVSTSYPQLFFSNNSLVKTGFLIGEGVWKWKLEEGMENGTTPVFNDLVGKIVQYLSVKDDKRKFKVSPSKKSFDGNEHILLNASLYNDSYQLVNKPDVNLQLKDEKGKAYNFTFSRFGSAYQLDAGMLPAGNYNYLATTTFGGKQYNAKGSLFVNALNAEYQQTIANHQLLYQMSAQTNGKMYFPDQLQVLKEELLKNDQIKTLSYEDRKYEELISFKWLFFFILLLLSTEWFIRKRNAAL